MRAVQCFFPASTPPVALRLSVPAAAAAGTRVAAALHAALNGRGRGPLAELRAATLAFAATLKAEGLPPEKVLVSLKTALTREGRSLSLAPVCCPDHAPETREHQMYAYVFGWYLEGYFGPPRLQSADAGLRVQHSPTTVPPRL